MKGNYNPFSKTYQILCFQQQTAHKKNLNSVKSVNQSNIKLIEKPKVTNRNSRKRIQSQTNLYESQILQPHRLIHKNEYYDKRENERRKQQNRRIASKLMNISCSVITRNESIKFYQDSRIYNEIGRKYSKDGNKRNFLRLDLTSSFYSTSKNMRKSAKKCGLSSMNESTMEPRTNIFEQEHMKPRYK